MDCEMVEFVLIGPNRLVYVGKEGAPAKEGITGVLDATKKKAEELMTEKGT